MSGFDSFVVLDWSAGNDTGPTPRKDAIWAAGRIGGAEFAPVYLRNRIDAEEWLARLIGREIAAGRRLLIGFDFPFGYPEGFADAILGTGPVTRMLDYYADHLTDTPKSNDRFVLAGRLNARFPGIGPFWFNGMRVDVPYLPRRKHDRTEEHGQKERRRCEIKAKGTFTCWQMGGAGAVGGQVMTGMAFLARLRRRFPGKLAVWPFEAGPAPVLAVEVWPSLIANVVRQSGDDIKDRAQVRLLSRALAALQPGRLSQMLSVDEPVEGWILGLGYEEELSRAACQS